LGHRKKNAPRRGSLAYSPRGRARRMVGRVRFWPDVKATSPVLLGFAGYKAGMTYAYVMENDQRSPHYGREVVQPVTVVETPPLRLCAIRAYGDGESGLTTLTEAWMKDPPKQLERVLVLPEKPDPEGGLKRIEGLLGRIAEFRAVLCTQPWLSNVPKKKPELIEVKIAGGSLKDQLDYGRKTLGKEVRVSDVFAAGQLVDVVSVSKGKGVQGPVKRWGVKKLPHKSRKTVRGIGCLGPWHPIYVMHTAPRAGQMGFHQRTECNKKILRIGKEGPEVTPKGGFLRYGVIRGDHILLGGSVPGAAKRLLRLRYPARPPLRAPKEPPQITYLSLESAQGR
jgi:large subunit ribosomal protein L3